MRCPYLDLSLVKCLFLECRTENFRALWMLFEKVYDLFIKKMNERRKSVVFNLICQLKVRHMFWCRNPEIQETKK